MKKVRDYAIPLESVPAKIGNPDVWCRHLPSNRSGKPVAVDPDGDTVFTPDTLTPAQSANPERHPTEQFAFFEQRVEEWTEDAWTMNRQRELLAEWIRQNEK